MLWTAFYDYILPDLNGVSQALVSHTLRNVVIEFCNETLIYVYDLPEIDVVAGTAEYAITSDVSGTEVVMAKAAWVNDVPLAFAPLEALNSKYGGWTGDTSQQPLSFTQKTSTAIILYPEPDTAYTDGLKVQVALRPTLAATGLVDWLATKYIQQLSAGCKGKLMAQPGRPWTNMELAQYNLSIFASAINDAKIETSRSLTRAVLSVRMRPAVR